MRKTIPFLLLLFCAPWLVFGQSAEQMPVVRKDKDYALFFAVNQYDKMRPLSNPIRDAEDIAKELKGHYGFATEVVKNPTLDQVEEKLKFYQKQFAAGRFASDGQLLIFFTGHGMVENKNGFFLAKDSDPEKLPRTAWAYAYWRPFLNAIGCKHILVSLDACFSGTFDPGWWSKSGFGRPGELSEGERLLVEHEKYKTRKFFTSATEVGSPDDSKFAKKFLEGLRSRGGRDGILTSTELFTYLEQASPKPHAGDFGDYDPGASFLFILDNPLENPSVNLEETNALERDLQAWKAARDANTIHAYRAYLQQFPNGEFRGLAIGRIQELEQEAANRREELAWEIAKEKNTKEAYLAYQREYPGGKYYKHADQWIQEEARRLLELERKKQAAEARYKEEQKSRVANDKGDQVHPGENPNGGLSSLKLEELATGSAVPGGGLGNRSVARMHKPKDDSQETGTVVVWVCVGRDGNVISADFTQKGSTTSSNHLIQLAVDSAKKWKFSPSGVAKECGEITYNFRGQ